jgi:hypothetical protein
MKRGSIGGAPRRAARARPVYSAIDSAPVVPQGRLLMARKSVGFRPIGEPKESEDLRNRSDHCILESSVKENRTRREEEIPELRFPRLYRTRSRTSEL